MSLCDTPGFMVGPEAEKTAIVRHVARMFVTGASLTVPLFGIVLRKGYGLGAQAMIGGGFHASFFTVAWPTGEFGGMGLEGYVRLGFRKEMEAIADPVERENYYKAKVAELYANGKAISIASVLEIDDVIDPAETRRWIMSGLRSVPKPPQRRGSQAPLCRYLVATTNRRLTFPEEFPMISKAFDTAIEDAGNALIGPWRQPRQMLHAQTYDSHASIHDDATAQKLGFKGGTIEARPISASLHRSVNDCGARTGLRRAVSRRITVLPPLRARRYRPLSKSRSMADDYCTIRMVKRDGTEVLGAAVPSIGRDAPASALDIRLTELKPLSDAVILRDIKLGMTTASQTVRMDFDQNMGELYPFSLEQKLKGHPEPSPYYVPGAQATRHGDARSFRWKCSACCFSTAARRIVCRSRGRQSACSLIRKSGCSAVRCSLEKTTA